MPTSTLKEHETTSEDEKNLSRDEDFSNASSGAASSSLSSGSSSDSSNSVPHVGGGGGRLRSQSGQECVVEKSPKGRFHRFNRKLGSGSYKTVYLAFDNDTGREVAWNVISFAHLSRHERKRIDDEIKIAKSLDHDRIISFINAWINKKKEEVVFITERVNGGSLRQYINRLDGPLKVKVIRMWCKQILEGINYLHNELKVPVIHRDLKCDNIFINGSDGKVLIGDLGLSTALQHASVATSIVGTPEFMAPELYEEKYGPPVDIYAFGMCLLEMVTRKFPYAECTTPGQIYKKVINGEMPESLERINNKELKHIIEQCIEKDPAKRPTAAELLAMPYWNQKDDGDELATLEPLPPKEGETEGPPEKTPAKEKGHRPRKTRGQSGQVDGDGAASTPPASPAGEVSPRGISRSNPATPRGVGDEIGRSEVSTVIHRRDAGRNLGDTSGGGRSGPRHASGQFLAPPDVNGDAESIKSTPARVGQVSPTPSDVEESDGMVTLSNRTTSVPMALLSAAVRQAVPPSKAILDQSSDTSEAPQLISATTHIEAANSPKLTGGEAVIRRDVAQRPPNEKVMAAVVDHDGTVPLPDEIEDFCRNQLHSDRVTKVVLLIETETDKFQRINFEYSLDEDTCDSIAEELLENNLVWREVNRDRLVQKIRQAVFVRVKQIALEEGVPLPPAVAAAIAGGTATKQGEQAAASGSLAEENGEDKMADSPPFLARASTPPAAAALEAGRRYEASEREPLTADAVEALDDTKLGSASPAVGATPPPANNPQTYAAVAATVPTSTPTTTASAPVATNLRAAVAVNNAQAAPTRIAGEQTTPVVPAVKEMEASTSSTPRVTTPPPSQDIVQQQQPVATSSSPSGATGVVSPSNHLMGSGKPPPAPRSISHAGCSGRHIPTGVDILASSSGGAKLVKKPSMSKYVHLTPESTAHLTNDTVTGVGARQVVPNFYKEVMIAEYGDSGMSGADSASSSKAGATLAAEVPIFPEIPPPLNDGHAPTEEDVAWVQIALAAVVPSVKLSAYPKLGVMCPATVDVIKSFQEYHSLPVDGNMDDRTWQLLVDSLESRRQKIEEREAKRAEAKLKAKQEAERKRQVRQAESAKAMDMMEKTLYSLSSGAAAGSATPALHHATSMVMPSQSSPPSQQAPVQHSSPSIEASVPSVLPGTPPRPNAAAVPRSGSVPPTVSPWVTSGAPLSRTVSYTSTPPQISRNSSLPNVAGVQPPQQLMDVFESLRRVSPPLSETGGSQPPRVASVSHSPPAEMRSLYSAPDSYSTTTSLPTSSTYQPPSVNMPPQQQRPSVSSAAGGLPVQQHAHSIGGYELSSDSSSILGLGEPGGGQQQQQAAAASSTASLDDLLTAASAAAAASAASGQHQLPNNQQH
ncbi:Serine/threonine-protein kinase wnk4 [Perkinsus chesapeaki]|uniref:Serine/threonine-protein kinase wnk4 n=1 Tax=Perkinsus chesapeaki TaxID=330153 RepID=A0A7J6N2L5_PERCH|nr:Serine/threonine-protein kinase wnk4 [Perkinsus chesapeaki]